MPNSPLQVGPIHAKGAVTVDFALPGNLPLDLVIPVIERDRMHMAARPGFRQKHLPIRSDPSSGNFLSGGRYLFDTVEHAEQCESWAENDFVLDGIRFFERPVFLDPVACVWRVAGGQDWADSASHSLIRFERWRLRPGHKYDIEQAWPRICAEGEARGLASAWLLQNEAERLAGLVSISRRSVPVDLERPDDASLRSFETSPSLGTMFEEPQWVKEFDRTNWVLTIWFPVLEGKPDVPALWPNSPPMPAPAYTMAAR
jgi:hypothetical protein